MSVNLDHSSARKKKQRLPSKWYGNYISLPMFTIDFQFLEKKGNTKILSRCMKKERLTYNLKFEADRAKSLVFKIMYFSTINIHVPRNFGISSPSKKGQFHVWLCLLLDFNIAWQINKGIFEEPAVLLNRTTYLKSKWHLFHPTHIKKQMVLSPVVSKVMKRAKSLAKLLKLLYVLPLLISTCKF